MTKKLINEPSNCVQELIEGLLATTTGLKRVEGFNVVVRSDIKSVVEANKVTIVSGGGSGHEPAHAGYIGQGMLSAVALGNVFASPSVATVLAAIRCVASPAGVLVIVKNYTGDRLNFGMAIEQARGEGINARMLVVEDDCALEPGKGITGGRGVCGTVLVHKIAGASAERGLSLDEVHDRASRAASSMGTMGVALSPCFVPGASVSDAASQRLTGRTVEVGMGIHGEPGRETMELPEKDAADALTDIMIDAIIGKEDGAGARVAIKRGDKAVVMINNLGATPVLELFIVARRVANVLKSRGIVLARAFVGSFMTSLEMGGVSVTILRSTDADQLSLFDAATLAPAWVPSTKLDVETVDQVIPYTSSAGPAKTVTGGGSIPGASTALAAICNKLIELEPKLTEYDTICGDGDCGIVMKAGATGVLRDLETHAKNEADAALFCSGVADSLSDSMGGTSGALLELALRAMSAHFAKNGGSDWGSAVGVGVEAMQFYGGATAGMRTMLDALIPASKALSAKLDLKAVAEAARKGADSTKTMASLAGRSNYIDSAKMDGVPDPGAIAIAAAFTALTEAQQ